MKLTDLFGAELPLVVPGQRPARRPPVRATTRPSDPPPPPAASAPLARLTEAALDGLDDPAPSPRPLDPATAPRGPSPALRAPARVPAAELVARARAHAEHVGEALTDDELARALDAVERPTAPGYGHAQLVLAAAAALMATPAGELAAQARARADAAPLPSASATLGGISSCEPPVIDPADLVVCECGLTVHRASLAGHLAVSNDFSRWSSHRERMAELVSAREAAAHAGPGPVAVDVDLHDTAARSA